VNKSPFIIALDFSSPKEALAIVEQLKSTGCRFKIGKELFTSAGPDFVRQLVEQGVDIFLDLKFHDIPNTVARACKIAANLGVWMLTVHASGGREMLMVARNALKEYDNPPLLIAVTILTSLKKEDLHTIGLHGSVEENVLNLARLAKACDVDGIVCSPQEIDLIRKNIDFSFQLITPGIRPVNTLADDQKRVMTPAEALQRGANYLVIGRPIIAALNPLQAFLDIQNSIF
jgi:orotidine-5'-phosphate decarboxylase